MIIDRILLQQQIRTKYGPCYWNQVFHDRTEFDEWMKGFRDRFISNEWDEFGVHLIEINDDWMFVEIVVIYDL